MKVSDEQILVALIEHGGISKAAKSLGINRNTITKKMKQDDFKSKWDALRTQMLEDATSSLQSGSVEAAQTARAILNDDDASPQVKLNAAGMILSNALRFTEQTDVIQRLEKLEEQARCEE